MAAPSPETLAASEANERGLRLAEAGDDVGAEREYQLATELDSSFEPAWFNLGLVYKRRRDWGRCAALNLKAAELDPVHENPAWWNLGIAATALRDWGLARRAWSEYGVKVPAGTGPLQMSLGLVPIRLNPSESGEVVWGRRIDPARVVIENVPLPESGHRYADVVLHDGEPRGERLLQGKPVPVFDELEIWEESGRPTVAVALICPATSDAEEVLERFRLKEIPAEDWSRSVRALCKACSEGRPHDGHDFNGREGWRTARNFGLAGDETTVIDVLEAWVAAGEGRLIEGIERAL